MNDFNSKNKFRPIELDLFSRLVNASLAERRKTDPTATYEASVRAVAKQYPQLWERHVHRVGSDGGL